MGADQAVCLFVMAAIGTLPYIGTCFSFEEPARPRLLFNRWWLALWAAPGAFVVVLTAVLG